VAVTPLDSFTERVVLAVVRQGTLVIEVTRAVVLGAAVPEPVRFAWMIDTAVPRG
jgi:hypothetical protein